MTSRVVPFEVPENNAATDPMAAEISRLTQQIGSMVRSARGSHGISRRELSEVSGVSQRYLAQIEAGEGNISVAMLVRLGAALNMSPSDFFAGEQSAKSVARIALIGLRGAGKSSLGQRLADASALPFVELNDVIERESGLPVSDVIALYGPDGYRGFERSALQSVVDRQAPLVLAVAGGIVDAPDTYDLLLSEFHTVWLQAAPEEHMNRVIAQGDERPMAGNPRAMEELKTILQRRESAYARAHGTLNTSGCSPAESASDLLKLIRDKAACIE